MSWITITPVVILLIAAGLLWFKSRALVEQTLRSESSLKGAVATGLLFSGVVIFTAHVSPLFASLERSIVSAPSFPTSGTTPGAFTLTPPRSFADVHNCARSPRNVPTKTCVTLPLHPRRIFVTPPRRMDRTRLNTPPLIADSAEELFGLTLIVGAGVVARWIPIDLSYSGEEEDSDNEGDGETSDET
ncbi:MAG: hypothetical protein ACYDCC_10290 [Actinomycetota bacterium]